MNTSHIWYFTKLELSVAVALTRNPADSQQATSGTLYQTKVQKLQMKQATGTTDNLK